ncbi:MAG: Ppx/GppA phosphatase family protein [Acidimicrobiales bacterium]
MARAAVWDLGSSSFQVLVCDADPCGGLEPVARRRALLNLGLSVGSTGGIPPDRVAASVSAVKRLRGAVDETRPDVVVALATAALRDAANGPEVVARLERVVGCPVRILDGAEEARLCLTGQRAGVWTGPGPTLGIDLGGGSFEVGVSDEHGLHFATSAPVGATRLRGELGAGDVLGPDMARAVAARTAEALEEIRLGLAAIPDVARRTVVSGGTARALARLATVRTRERGSSGSSDVNQVELPAGQVAAMAQLLQGLDLEQRLALPGMSPRRAPMLPIGAAILSAVADGLGIEHYVVSVWGLREGALLDALRQR